MSLCCRPRPARFCGTGFSDQVTHVRSAKEYQAPAFSASRSKHPGQNLRQRFRTMVFHAVSGSTMKVTGLAQVLVRRMLMGKQLLR